MFGCARFQGDMMPEPATFEDQARGRCELANILAQKPPRFLREDPVAPGRFLRVNRRRQQSAFRLAMPIDLEKVFVYSAAKEFVFPGGERWSDPETGIKFGL